MAPLRHIGTCLPFFLLAVTFDLLGLVLLFVGIFGDLRVRGRFYGDFLIYSGSLVIFASLACWLMWYVGNIRLSERDAQPRSRAALLDRRLSLKLGAQDRDRSQDGTWGKSGAYGNQAYDGSTDGTEPVPRRSED